MPTSAGAGAPSVFAALREVLLKDRLEFTKPVVHAGTDVIPTAVSPAAPAAAGCVASPALVARVNLNDAWDVGGRVEPHQGGRPTAGKRFGEKIRPPAAAP
ncbi:MAG: hypothetical protein ACE5KM_13370 [Planctomycetaceae bacterium]